MNKALIIFKDHIFCCISVLLSKSSNKSIQLFKVFVVDIKELTLTQFVNVTELQLAIVDSLLLHELLGDIRGFYLQ